MAEEEIHNMIRLAILGGMLKKCMACLVKDHSILLKAFSKSILRIMLAIFPFIFDKFLMYSCTMIALSETFLLARKLDCEGLMMSVRKGFSLLSRIFVMILY